MKYETSKRKNILVVLIVVILVLCIGLFMKNKTNTLNNTSINEESIVEELNENLIGAYIQQGEEYVKADTIPTSGYEFNEEESYCKIGDAIQENMTLFYDMETQTLTVSPIAKEGTKCYLYFDKQASAAETILASPNAPTGQTTDWTNNGTGITYYYIGNPDNWLQFAGFYWRIIRINGDGSIRMIYQGVADSETPDSGNITGTGTQIGTSAFNSSYNNNAYVGYMYGNVNATDYAGTHANTNSSTIKGVLDQWYHNNLETRYGQYIDGNAGFCGDRRISSGTGIGTSTTNYQPYTRIRNSNPNLTCETLDIYTTVNSSTGNKSLQYSIGLISAEEVAIAGGTFQSDNDSYYLYIGEDYWTITPSLYGRTLAYAFYVGSNGSISYINGVNFIGGVRPVINLRSDVSITGSGTTSDPFKVVGAS